MGGGVSNPVLKALKRKSFFTYLLCRPRPLKALVFYSTVLLYSLFIYLQLQNLGNCERFPGCDCQYGKNGASYYTM